MNFFFPQSGHGFCYACLSVRVSHRLIKATRDLKKYRYHFLCNNLKKHKYADYCAVTVAKRLLPHFVKYAVKLAKRLLRGHSREATVTPRRSGIAKVGQPHFLFIFTMYFMIR